MAKITPTDSVRAVDPPVEVVGYPEGAPGSGEEELRESTAFVTVMTQRLEGGRERWDARGTMYRGLNGSGQHRAYLH